MPEIIMYVKDYCPYCHRAKALLVDELSQSVKLIDLVEHPERRDEMVSKSNGRTTVPQIFINGQHIGGCDDLMACYSSGKLKQLLTA